MREVPPFLKSGHIFGRVLRKGFFFDVCYIIEFVRGLAVLLHRLRLPESSFLPRGIENGQLLHYGHAYQLSVCVNVKNDG